MDANAKNLPLTGKRIDQMSREERLHLADALRQARNAQNLSQQELADCVGVSRGTIVNFEAGKSTPRDQTIRSIVRVLGASQVVENGETEKYLDLIGPLIDQLNDENKRIAFENFVRVITRLLTQQRTKGEGGASVLEDLG